MYTIFKKVQGKEAGGSEHFLLEFLALFLALTSRNTRERREKAGRPETPSVEAEKGSGTLTRLPPRWFRTAKNRDVSTGH